MGGAMTFSEACVKAAERSRDFECTVFVCAQIIRDNSAQGESYMVAFNGYCISDWSDGTVVAKFTNGQRD